MKTIALAVMLAFSGCVAAAPAYAETNAGRGVSNPPNIPIPANPAGWCTATQLVPGTTRTTQIGDCPQVSPTSCPAGRLTVANIKYPNVPPSSAIRRNVDVTKYENIWGHASTVDTALPFPGRNGATPAIQWTQGTYIAAQFVAPANTTTYETLRYSTYYSGPAITMTVSERCGDMAPVNPNCKSVANTGESFKKIVSFPYTNGCPVIPGRVYYVNMFLANGSVPPYISTNLIIGNQP